MGMKAKESSSMKNLIIHSALLELYYKQRRHISLNSLLCKIGVLQKFTLVEVISAKIYSNMVIRFLPQYNSLEIFLTMCIIFRKYWNDFSLKNMQEVDRSILNIKKLNRIETEILKTIQYTISITKDQIQREIEIEKNVDKTYKEAMSVIKCIAMQ
ncbi:hypothetical protein NEMIN01_2416 [Nematocida minor]|uniref:uncharacterized protein n=1 Tax=Nematocida minor TaxID=1912983 RepID=UPI002220DFC6|nr:uncharacterized protein NEMIN01_2416 [Nematocida minor]KAI5193216.1 hypothetical protein NEMIN01_2416 [Nematocida minor]